MKLKNLTRSAIVATAVGVAGLGIAFPAAAADVYCSGYYCDDYYTVPDTQGNAHYHAEVDNNPGDGRASWLWVGSDNAYAPHVDFYLRGDSGPHKANGKAYGALAPQEFDQDITAFRVCGSHGAVGDACSAWFHPKY